MYVAKISTQHGKINYILHTHTKHDSDSSYLQKILCSKHCPNLRGYFGVHSWYASHKVSCQWSANNKWRFPSIEVPHPSHKISGFLRKYMGQSDKTAACNLVLKVFYSFLFKLVILTVVEGERPEAMALLHLTHSKCLLGWKSQEMSSFYLICDAILHGPSERASWWSGRSKLNTHMASPLYGCVHASSNFPSELLWRGSEGMQKAFPQCECEHVS